MPSKYLAPVALAALALASAGEAPAASSAAHPQPTATPLKTIKHVYSTTRLCTGLRRSVYPAVGRILANDKTIAQSRPLLQDFVQSANLKSEGGKDMAVERLENLVTPLVKNTQAIEQFLNDPVYAHKAQNDNDKQLLTLRAQLKQVLESQKQALDLVSGFVQTEQLGQLRAAGHEYDTAISGNDTTHQQPGQQQNQPSTSPTTAPAEILNAGVGSSNDPARKNDPRFQTTDSALGYNPLNAFDQQMLNYQTQIAQSESHATFTIMKAVPVCGGQVPGASPAPIASPIVLPPPTPTPTPRP